MDQIPPRKVTGVFFPGWQPKYALFEYPNYLNYILLVNNQTIAQTDFAIVEQCSVHSVTISSSNALLNNA